MRPTISGLLLPVLLSCGAPSTGPEEAPTAAEAAPPAPARPPLRTKPRIRVVPTTTRFVDIFHTRWKKSWAIRLPEAIASRDLLFMDSRTVHPDWRQVGESSWRYVWRSPADAQGAAYGYAAGLKLLAQIDALDSGIRLRLTLFNESADTFHDLSSEGGCLQARHGQFVDGNEVGRTHVMVGGKMTSLGDLDCASEIRCHYLTGFKATKAAPKEGLWRNSAARIESPAIIGAVSRNGKQALALGYEGSWSALQNTDAHHCIHSSPYFGDLKPGESATRLGFVLFGHDLNQVARDLSNLLDDRSIRLPAGGAPT